MNFRDEQLCAYIERLLGSRDEEEIRAALSTDSELKHRFDLLRGVLPEQLVMGDLPVPADLLEKTLGRLEAEGAFDSSPPALPPGLERATLVRLEREGLVATARAGNDRPGRRLLRAAALLLALTAGAAAGST